MVCNHHQYVCFPIGVSQWHFTTHTLLLISVCLRPKPSFCCFLLPSPLHCPPLPTGSHVKFAVDTNLEPGHIRLEQKGDITEAHIGLLKNHHTYNAEIPITHSLGKGGLGYALYG